ncbi:hypothetical protein [Rhizobium sullae]|uniref:Uncharacterized protein n=1 Tax=Rhizobium sullae TaxID=50338 RepID=A0A4R3Q035_RHISU|nr:hypothetical protein [Rhizobium sullae]TCU13704.1 hypothetical protein EV132_111137 [Rhizobium sullae]
MKMIYGFIGTGTITATMVEGMLSSALPSAYIYQIYSCIRSQAGRNDPLADKAEGILLHPAIDRQVDEAVTIQGHRIRFVTVDLAADASVFQKRLREIVTVPV